MSIDELVLEYRTLDDVLASFARLQEFFYHRHDRRAVFATAYLNVTSSIKSLVLAKGFRYSDWVGRYAVASANLYRAALVAYEKGDSASVPRSWKLAFDSARNNEALAIQDLLLGINAHVNHDLPFALAAVSIHPDRAGRLEDHTAVNQLLRASAGRLEDGIQAMYAPGLHLLGRAFHPIVTDLTPFDLTEASELSWDNAVSLVDARSGGESASIARRIDEHSGVLARLVLAPTARRLVLDSLRRIESVAPWWKFLTLPDLSIGDPARVSEQPLAVNNLDDLISRLNTVVERFDARRSRLSVDPAVHVQACRKIKEALAAGTFACPDWVTRLTLYLGTFYLNAVAAFDQGRVDQIPECWFMAFQTATAGGNLLLQDLLAALNARLNYDLPLALVMAGIDAKAIDGQFADFEKLQVIMREHIIAVEESVVNTYSHGMLNSTLLAGPLQGILAEFPFDRAHEAAWHNALALAATPSEAERQRLLHDLDRKAGVVTQRILLKGLPGASWVILALRHIEGEFAGVWSAWPSPPFQQS